MNSYLSEQPVNDYSAERSVNPTNCHRSTESGPPAKPSKSSRISFLNTALQSVTKINRRGECRKLGKSKASQRTEKTPPSVYLEEHKGMDWRLQQLGYQLPEQDERLLADNPHLSNELKFLRLQQKLSSIPVKLYINGGSPGNNSTNSSNNSSTNGSINGSTNGHSNNSSCNSDHSTSPEQPEHAAGDRPICCAKCEQTISKSTYCVQADLKNFSFVLSAIKCGQSSVRQTVYFHIDCLQCVTCGEILVDFRAYLDPRTVIDDLAANYLRIYCSRHFLELFKPRCELCEELIFDKKCTQAENKAWHVQHFTCHQCKVPLGGQQYKMADLNQRAAQSNNDDKMRLEDLHKAIQRKQTKEVHPFCLSCCDQLFGEYCARCDQLITCDQNPVKFEKYFWHATPDCFHCDTCGITLVNSDYLPSGNGKQIFCSTKCAQSLQPKDLNNLNSGLMKLNDRLRNSHHHKPTLNSVQEEDLNSLDDPMDRVATDQPTNNTKVEYENLKSELFQVGDQSVPAAEQENNHSSPQSSLSSNRSLSSLSLLFTSPSSPESSREENTKNSIGERLQTDETPKKCAAANSSPPIESVCSAESNQLNSSTSMNGKEIKSSEQASESQKDCLKENPKESSKREKKIDVDEVVVDKKQPPTGEPDQRLVPFAIVDNNPFTRTSIIIDNLNMALSALQVLDDQEQHKDDACPSTDTSSTGSSSALSNSPNSDSSSRNDKNNDRLSSNDLVQEKNVQTAFPSSLSGHNVAVAVQSAPAHYSTLPTRRTQRKPFKYEEPSVQTMSNYYRFLNGQNVVQNGCKFPTHTNSSPAQPLIGAKPVVDSSMNEVGLPVPAKVNTGPSNAIRQFNQFNHFNQFNQFNNVNLSSFVNCTLPRSNRHHNQTQQQTPESAYLNGVHSVSVSKLNAMMLQSSLARVPANNLGSSLGNGLGNGLSNHSNGNQSINTSTNSDFSIASSTSTQKLSSNNSAILTNNLNSHSVVVSEDQIVKLNSQLVVKPLPNGGSLKLLPPHQHGFVKKWSTTASNSSSINSNNQLGDLPVIQEHLSSSNPGERTSSATPSLSSSIEMQSNDTPSSSSNEKDECAIENQHQNLLSSNNSLNNTINLMQTNLNSSNSASLISGTSSINSTISSNGGESTPQLGRQTGLIHNRPDVICFLNPIETIKQQLKQKERELKLKERMLKKAEQQSIENLKPKIVEEKLKMSTLTAEKPTGKNVKSASIVSEEEKDKKLLHQLHTSHKKANSRTMSINNINEIQANGQLNAKLTGNRHAVSNSLSSLNRPAAVAGSPKNSANQLTHRSQPNLLIGNRQESNGETCSSSSTPDHLEQQFNQLSQFNDRLNKFNQLTHHLNQLKNQSANPSPSSQYSPTNSVSVTNDTDCSLVVNSVEMDNRVQFQKTENDLPNGLLNGLQQSHKKRPPQSSSLKDAQQQSKQPHGGKACESQASLQKQKSVSFDPNVIENENNKAPKRLSKSHRKKFAGSRSDNYEPQHRRRRSHHSGGHSSGHSGSYQHDHYHHGSYKSNRRRHHYYYEEDDFCFTCSDSSCSSSSSVCSSSSDEEETVDHRRSGHPTCHGRKGPIKQGDKANDKLSQLAGVTKKAGAKLQAGASNIAAEKIVELMQQQQLIIQQQLALQQMQPQSKQQRYLKNNTNESCVIS